MSCQQLSFDDCEDPILWWETDGSLRDATTGALRFPILKELAESFLCCMATAVPSESLFSTARKYNSSLVRYDSAPSCQW